MPQAAPLPCALLLPKVKAGLHLPHTERLPSPVLGGRSFWGETQCANSGACFLIKGYPGGHITFCVSKFWLRLYIGTKLRVERVITVPDVSIATCWIGRLNESEIAWPTFYLGSRSHSSLATEQAPLSSGLFSPLAHRRQEVTQQFIFFERRKRH